jgi:flagellar protein FlaD
MEKGEGDRKKSIFSDFDFKSELSALVEKRVIPSRIADKLEKKLTEKNVKITREQLNLLVDKIVNLMKNYTRYAEKPKDEPTPKSTQLIDRKTDTDMLKLVQTIERLEERINKIETGTLGGTGIVTKGDIKFPITKERISSPKIVTTEDIKVPGSNFTDLRLDPLTEIPNDPESVIVLMKWLQYLIDKCGRSNLSTILEYYVDIGWISQDAKMSLMDYSQGITEENKRIDAIKKEVSNLPSKDHIQSLLFIQKLKGRDFDRHFIDRIDDDLSRFAKKTG